MSGQLPDLGGGNSGLPPWALFLIGLLVVAFVWWLFEAHKDVHSDTGATANDDDGDDGDDAGDPAHKGGDPAHKGDDPAHKGGDPAHKGGDPAHKGGLDVTDMGDEGSFSCAGFVPASSTKTNYYDTVNDLDDPGSSQSQQQWNADNKLALQEQKQRNDFALKQLQEQGKNQKQIQAFREKMTKMQYQNEQDARRLEAKTQTAHDKAMVQMANQALKNRQNELNNQLQNHKIGMAEYLKEMQISMQDAHQARLDAMAKLKIQVSDEEKKLKIKMDAEHQKRVDDLAEKALELKDKALELKKMELNQKMLSKRTETAARGLGLASPSPAPATKAPMLPHPPDDGEGAVSSMRSRIRLDYSPRVMAMRTSVMDATKDAAALEAIRSKARHYKDQLVYRATDESYPAEQRSMYRELFRVQLEILQADTLEGAKRAEADSSHKNYAIARAAYDACLLSAFEEKGGRLAQVEHAKLRNRLADHKIDPGDYQKLMADLEASEDRVFSEAQTFLDDYMLNHPAAAYTQPAFCSMPCTQKENCTMRKHGHKLLQPIKTCGHNYYPVSKPSGAHHFDFHGMCVHKCNPDLDWKQPQPCHKEGCSQKRVMHDGNVCGCPADMHFKDRVACKTTHMPHDRPNDNCEPMYGGSNCDSVDTVFTSAQKHPLLRNGVVSTLPEDQTFTALCPTKHQYADRSQCRKGSACMKRANPLVKSACPMQPYALHFTNRGKKDGDCTECVHSDGSDKPTNRRAQWCGDRYICACPEHLHFADRDSCDHTVVAAKRVSAKAAAVLPAPGPSAAVQALEGEKSLTSSVVVDVSNRKKTAATCAHGWASLPGKPYCQVCANGFEPTFGNNFQHITACTPINPKFCGSDPNTCYRCGVDGSSEDRLQAGLAQCGKNCNPDPHLDQKCHEDAKYCCKSGDKGGCSKIGRPPCCKDPDRRMDKHGNCVCANAELLDQRNCTNEPPPDADATDYGFAVFHNKVINKKFVSADWTDTAKYDGTMRIKPCKEPCEWHSKQEALLACSQWSDCMGVYEVDETERGHPFDTPEQGVSTKRTRLGPLVMRASAKGARIRSARNELIIPVSAKASVFRPIRSHEIKDANSKTLLEVDARLNVAGSSPDGVHKTAQTLKKGATVYTKICKRAGRDPKTDCKDCLPPYKRNASTGTCECPPELDPRFCSPTKCLPNSGLDPGTQCKACVNKNMVPNSSHICVCDPKNKQLDPEGCGGLDNTHPIKCATGSGLQPPDCTHCATPRVRDFFMELNQKQHKVDGQGHDTTLNTYCPRKNSLLRAPSKCGPASGSKCKGESDCLSQCAADIDCKVATFAPDGTCALYDKPPTRKCATNAIKSDTKLYFHQNLAAPMWDASINRCACPHVGQEINPTTSVCECKNARYSPETCGTKVDGTITYVDGELTLANARAECKKKGGRLATIRDDGQQERVATAMHELPVSKKAFINVGKQKTTGGAQFLTWLDNNEHFFNVTAGQPAKGAYIGPPEEQKKATAGLMTTSIDNGDCMAVYNDQGHIKWEVMPCESKHGYVCELNPMPRCRNDTLDPKQDCKKCKTSHFVADPLTFECEPREGINPEWKATDPHPPLKKFEKSAPSELDYFLRRDANPMSKTKPYVFGQLPVSPANPVGECATACLKYGRDKQCVGFMLGENPQYGVTDTNTCLFFTQRSGLGNDSQGKTIAKPDSKVDTYLMQYCTDDRAQFWSDAPCTSFEGTELTPQGTCPASYSFKDPYNCERYSQCSSTGIEDATTHTNSGHCNRAACVEGVESSDPANGKFCDVCKYKNTVGDIYNTTANNNCLRCDTNHTAFDPQNPKDCECLPIFTNRNPKTNCTTCNPGFSGLDCKVTRDSCHDRGNPQPSATEYYVDCKCDTTSQDNIGTFAVHYAGRACDECADGFGPEPDINGTYACSVRVADTRCGPLGLPIGAKVNPRDLTSTACDCRPRNKSYTEAENGGEPEGHWGGQVCDKCDDTTEVNAFAQTDVGKSLVIKKKAVTLDGVKYTVDWKGTGTVKDVDGKILAVDPNPGGKITLTGGKELRNPLVAVKAYGGQHCNLDRSHCNQRGTPGPNGKYGAAESPECVCDVNNNFRSGIKSSCADGDCTTDWYGRLCDVPIHACGIINKHQFGPDPNYAKDATPSDPKCLCDTPELMTDLTYDKAATGPSKCVCVDPLVLLSEKNSLTPKCVNKHEYCYNRGTYNTKLGRCECKGGYTGDRCDQCADGFANIQGSPLNDVTGKCSNVQEYCNYHADPKLGKSGFNEENHTCHCTPEYDVSQDSTCRAPACSSGHSPFAGPVPVLGKDGKVTMAKADPLRCVSNRDACGENATAVGPAIVNNKCVCKEDKNTGQFYTGNTKPYGDGSLIDPTPIDPYRPMRTDVCQYGPTYCNHPHGKPNADGTCECVRSAGQRCEHTRKGTLVHPRPKRNPKAARGYDPPAGSSITGNANKGCYNRGHPVTSSGEFFGVGPEWVEKEKKLFFGEGGPSEVVTLESKEYKPAARELRAEIAKVVILRKHSHTDGRFGWEGRRLWVDKGLSATFRVSYGSLKPGSRIHNTALTEALVAKRRHFTYDELDRFGIREGELDVTSYVETDDKIYFPVARGTCACEDVNKNGQFCQYTFKHTCNGRGVPNMEGQCGMSGREPKLGTSQQCTDGYSGFDCSFPPLGYPMCHSNTHCQEGCFPEGKQYNCLGHGSGPTFSCCDKNKHSDRCCGGEKKRGSGCGINESHPARCAKDPNDDYYPCVCTNNKKTNDEHVQGHVMTASSKSSGQDTTQGWRARPENSKLTLKDAKAKYDKEVYLFDLWHVPRVDAAAS